MLLAALLWLLAPADTGREALEARIAVIAPEAGGTVGVCVLHLESGRGASLHGGQALPMASVFKLPVAVEVLRRVDRGALKLDQNVALGPGDMRFHSVIAEHASAGRATLSIGELLEAMIVDGDNTAADRLLTLAGGPEVITAQLEEAGFPDIRVDRGEAEIAFDFAGVSPPPPPATWSLTVMSKAIDGAPQDSRRAAYQRFLGDPRDTATPDAMVQLLRSVQEGRRLSPESRERLLTLMTKSRTGPQRLRGKLPAGIPVAHRTGTCGDFGSQNACTNDVGIVTLPGGGGHVLIAVFVKGSDRSLEARERAIAQIARAAYDHWAR
jgi:beta-lactamase class A